MNINVTLCLLCNPRKIHFKNERVSHHYKKNDKNLAVYMLHKRWWHFSKIEDQIPITLVKHKFLGHCAHTHPDTHHIRDAT